MCEGCKVWMEVIDLIFWLVVDFCEVILLEVEVGFLVVFYGLLLYYLVVNCLVRLCYVYMLYVIDVISCYFLCNWL